MRTEAYIRVLGDEGTIRKFEQEVNVPDARIRQLKARRDSGGEETLWNWRTASVFVNIDTADEELRGLLLTHRSIFPTIRKYKAFDTDVYLEVTIRFEEGEEPRGFYLSHEVISLLNEMGGALDLDAVPVVPDKIKKEPLG